MKATPAVGGQRSEMLFHLLELHAARNKHQMEEEKTGKKKSCLVFYPSPGMGHLVSMVELAKRFLPYSFDLTVVVAEPPYNTGDTASYIRSVAGTHPSITFHRLLPPVTLPLDASPSTNHEAFTYRFVDLNNPLLHDALLRKIPVSALLLDFFCFASMEYAARLGIPSYVYYTSSATCLAVTFNLPTLHTNCTSSLKDMVDTVLDDVPGVPPLPASYMPTPVLDREDEAYWVFLRMSMEIPKCRGILVNTFEALEPRAMRALSEGACIPDGPTPRIFPIGPVIAADNRGGEWEYLSWLDSQSAKSVVFLCFGSLGLFSAEQLKEIAIGLEKSEQRFLWVVRSPPSPDDKTAGRLSVPPEPDLEALLPKGFMERTRNMGMVVKSWAPQAAILSHDSVGGFVTHCGWNSILEAICAGVPMVAWPLYAEQKLNKVFLTKEAQLAIPVSEEENGLVTAAEVEKRLRELMESEEGKGLRERTVATRDAAMVAVNVGGSSLAVLTEFAESLKQLSIGDDL
ncbi:hypothetical protein H6P81_017422 [Aristolochia fimbriata]|uniref:Glycosyltransferase n=1 Tax=Aristolochia fimbriata TaxID=158543 RepID=A0AAV7DYY8_ARIFI|nr:hypothetical protein H6P81_017422 [Aristolochia fimbriata]